MKLILVLLLLATVTAAQADPVYLCTDGTREQVFVGDCPNGWWIKEVLSG